MIKGVNRQIIEVTDTGNEYFERALLVVRAGFSDTSPMRLSDEAQRFVKNADGYSGLRINRRRRKRDLIVYCGGFGAIGMAAGALLTAAIR